MTLSQNDLLDKTGVTYEPVPGVKVQQPAATAAAPVPATVGGIVGSTGSIVAGSQFTVTHTGTGTYTVAFNTAFSATPTIVATVHAVDRIISIGSPATTGFTVTIHTTAASGSDAQFSFFASEIA